MPPAIIYRTTDGLKWGAGKGANLTPGEVDDNFWELVQALLAIEVAEPNEITSITVLDNAMTIHMEDGSTFGPFTLPTAKFVFRGVWADATEYEANDLFTQADSLYFVNQAHTSAAPFNAAAGNMLGAFATLVMPFPNSYSTGFFFPGKPGFGIVNEDLYQNGCMFSFLADRTFYLPEDLTGTRGLLRIAPAEDLVFLIYRNDDEIGSITFATGELEPTYEFTSPQLFDPGDTLRVLRPDDLDDDARDLNITFHGFLGALPS